MSPRTIPIDDALHAYLLSVSLREPDVLRRLREETQAMEHGQMQIAPEQGQLMAFLVELIGARRGIEIGTFTGYSALRVALAMPEDGRLIACDVNERWTSVARRYWAEAGVAHKVDLRLGPALATLDGLIVAGEAGSFDYAFIDADKSSYDDYLERVLALLRPGGIALIDNVLWNGRVANPGPDPSADTRALMAFNRKLHGDARVSISMVPIGDGLTLLRKRPIRREAD